MVAASGDGGHSQRPAVVARFDFLPPLFVSYSGLLGGAERFALDMATGLEETPSLACPDGPFAEAARAAGLHVIVLRERPLELRASVRDWLASPLRIASH